MMTSIRLFDLFCTSLHQLVLRCNTNIKRIKLYISMHFIKAMVTGLAVIALMLILQARATRDFLYESAIRGGAMSAHATESLGNIAMTIRPPEY